MSELATNLAQRDKMIKHIKKENWEHEQKMAKKMHELQSYMQHNSYLKDVYDEYDKYHKDALGRKKEQLRLFDNLLQYLDSVTNQDKQDDEIKTQIKREMNKIRKEAQMLRSMATGGGNCPSILGADLLFPNNKDDDETDWQQWQLDN